MLILNSDMSRCWYDVNSAPYRFKESWLWKVSFLTYFWCVFVLVTKNRAFLIQTYLFPLRFVRMVNFRLMDTLELQNNPSLVSLTNFSGTSVLTQMRVLL